jgi:hypothetical protein
MTPAPPPEAGPTGRLHRSASLLLLPRPLSPKVRAILKETRERLQDGITIALRAVPLAISTRLTIWHVRTGVGRRADLQWVGFNRLVVTQSCCDGGRDPKRDREVATNGLMASDPSLW